MDQVFEIDFLPTAIVCCNLELSDYSSCSGHFRIKFQSIQSNPDLIVKCKACSYSFSSMRSLKNHIRNHHSNYLHLISFKRLSSGDTNESSSSNSRRPDFASLMDIDETEIFHESSTCDPIQMQMMQIICQKKSKLGLAHNATCEVFLAGMQFAQELANKSELNEMVYDQLNEIAKNPTSQIKRILNLSNLKFKVDSEILDGEELKWYYFSVESTVFDLVFRDSGLLLDEVVKENTRQVIPGLFKGFKDGEIDKNRTAIEQNVIEIRIQLYTDEVRKTKQKATQKTNITVVLMVIENVPYFYQSSRDSISILMIGTYHILTQVKKHRFLKKLTDELIELKDKLIPIDSGKHIGKFLKIKVVGFDGDNKAMNMMMCISENFSKSSCCRNCMANNNEMQTLNQFDLNQRHLPSNHVLKGIVEYPMCYSLDFFHDMIGNIKTVISTLIFKNYNSAQQKVSLINVIKQTPFENGRIELNFNQKSINFTSGAQLIEFFFKFSFIDTVCLDSSEYVDVPEYKLYWLLRKIYNVYSKFEISGQELESADKNVRSLIKKCISLKVTIKPKMHNLLHYKRFVQLYGSIIKHSTLRYERKNQDIIKDVKTSKNNLDVPLSIAQWYVIKRVTGPEIINPHVKPFTCQENRFSEYINMDYPCFEYLEYESNKVFFKSKKFFILNKDLGIGDLVIGKVLKILKQNDDLKIICERYHANSFDEKKLFYKLSSKQETTLLDINSENLYHIHLYVIEISESAILFKTF